MNLDISISSTNLLTQKQHQEIADLTALCHRHDGTGLSYPSDEEDLTHILGYLPDGRLAACLTLIPYEETLAECCAFTHPGFRRQGFFSRLLDEALSRYPDVDLLFAVSEGCGDALKTLAALGAEKDSEEHMMECDLGRWRTVQHSGSADNTSASGQTLRPANSIDASRQTLKPADSINAFRQTSPPADTGNPNGAHPFSLTRISETEYTLHRSGILCGTTSAEPVSKTTVCLHHVEILPKFRNQGCGTVFLQLLLPELARKGFQKAILQVAGDNAPAIALYKKTGFSITKTLSYYFY